MNFLGLTFLNPLFLVGMASAVVPLLLHLSRSRRTKTLCFSTTRFFTDQFLRSYRMSRLKELLLLLCRMALFGLLAAALAQPLLLPSGSAGLRGPRAVVVVLDDSASMSAQLGDSTALGRAKEAALTLFESLGPEDTFSVVLSGATAEGPRVLIEHLPRRAELYTVDRTAQSFTQIGPTADRDWEQAVQSLTRLEPRPLPGDLPAAIARADALTRGRSAESREIYVLSDLQDADWPIPEGNASPLPSGSSASLTFVRIRAEQPTNVAVTALQFGAPQPLAGVPFTFRPSVVFQGPTAESRTLRLIIDGKEVASQTVGRPRVGDWVRPRFKHTFRAKGRHWGYVEVDDPVLPLDNRRWFVLDVLENVRVTAVNGAPSTIATNDELFFLKAALSAGDDGSSTAFTITERAPSDLANQPLWSKSADNPPPDVLILANVESLSLAAVENLEEFVYQGGRALIFLGERVNASAYNRLLADPNRRGGLLPARLGVLHTATDDSSAAALGDLRSDHPALTGFADEVGALGEIRFRSFYHLESPGAEVLMRTDDGRPLLVEKGFGRGRVLLFASTCDRDWNNLVTRPAAYLVLMLRLTAYLAQEPLGRQGFLRSGEPLAIPTTDTGATVTVRLPKADGSPGGTSAYPQPLPDDPQRLVFSPTDRLGIYGVQRAGEPEERIRLAAVNLSADESNLVYLDDVVSESSAPAEEVGSGLQKLVPGHPIGLVRFIPDTSAVALEAASSRRTIGVWRWLLIVVFVTALLEPWLANRITLLRYPAAERPTT